MNKCPSSTCIFLELVDQGEWSRWEGCTESLWGTSFRLALAGLALWFLGCWRDAGFSTLVSIRLLTVRVGLSCSDLETVPGGQHLLRPCPSYLLSIGVSLHQSAHFQDIH